MVVGGWIGDLDVDSVAWCYSIACVWWQLEDGETGTYAAGAGVCSQCLVSHLHYTLAIDA